jgi:Transposase DNA-binding/Transposase DDE domain
MRKSGLAAASVVSEFDRISLGDRRLDERLLSLVRSVCQAPAESLPTLLGTSAKREAAYRFFANKAVAPEAMLAPHVTETVKRMGALTSVRIIHDTSRFAFSGEREGLGTLAKDTRGFFGHFALAVDATELREPLGILAMRTFVNDDEGMADRRKLTRSKVLAEWRKTPRERKARHRWESLALEVAQKVPEGVRAIHVMDQEADDFHVFYALLTANVPFVIRGAGSRLTEQGPPLREVLEAHEHYAFREVRVSRRPKATRKMRHTPRDERRAELRIRFAPVALRRPNNVKDQIPAEHLSLHVVHVFEPAPPAGEEPVEWVLLTSESVRTFEEALAVADHYRARWLIEEYFKALKTGCAFEKRQLTTYDGLRRMLAMFIPIAWQLLRIRYLARQPTPPPATHVLDAGELQLLRALLRAESDYKLPAKPTTRDVLFALAALGGHIRNNGEPGWLVIGRGYEDFRAAARGWNSARLLERCDQS